MKNTQHRNYVDTYGYMLEKSREQDGDDGRGDAVARTVLAAIIYREQRFIDAIMYNFVPFLDIYRWMPIRHIEDRRSEDFSRDHTIWFVIWLRYFFPKKIYLCMLIPKRISEKFRQSWDMPFWFRALAKDRWIDNFLYWAIVSIMLRCINRWNRGLRWRANIVSKHYKSFKATPANELNKKELFARKYCVPSYSMDTQAFMIKCLSDSWFKRRLKKRILPLVEKTNWHVRLLMDDVFTPYEAKQVVLYSGMDSNRMARRMDKTTDIDIDALYGPQPPYNMDVDFLKCNMDYV